MTERNVKTWPHRKCFEGRSKENELAACLERETKKNFQKHSPMSFIIDGDDHKILSVSDFHDDWDMKAWKEIVNECHEVTDHIKECDDVRVVTTVDERLAGQGNNITLVELVPANASFEYIHGPIMDIETFLPPHWRYSLNWIWLFFLHLEGLPLEALQKRWQMLLFWLQE